MTTTYLRCDDCDTLFNYNDTCPAVNILQRHDLGDMFSDRQCVRCGALVFPAADDADVPVEKLYKVYVPTGQHRVYMVRAVDETVAIKRAIEYREGFYGIEKLQDIEIESSDFDPPFAKEVSDG